MTKYRYTLIILGFYLENNVYDKDKNKKNFSLDFFVRKLILGLRIDLDILYVFYPFFCSFYGCRCSIIPPTYYCGKHKRRYHTTYG